MAKIIKNPVPDEVVIADPGMRVFNGIPQCYTPSDENIALLNQLFAGKKYKLSRNHLMGNADGSDTKTLDSQVSYGRTELEARKNGIFMTNMEFTRKGAQLVEDGEFEDYSVEVYTDAFTHEIVDFERITLTNNPADPKASLQRKPVTLNRNEREVIMNCCEKSFHAANEQSYLLQESTNMEKKTATDVPAEATAETVVETAVVEEPVVQTLEGDGGDGDDDPDDDKDGDVENLETMKAKYEEECLRHEETKKMLEGERAMREELEDEMKRREEDEESKREDESKKREDETVKRENAEKVQLLQNRSTAVKAYLMSKSLQEVKDYCGNFVRNQKSNVSKAAALPEQDVDVETAQYNLHVKSQLEARTGRPGYASLDALKATYSTK